MNTASKFNMTDIADTDKKAAKNNRTEKLYLVAKNNDEDKKVTLEYLNEKLTYFYNNGGPIMDI